MLIAALLDTVNNLLMKMTTLCLTQVNLFIDFSFLSCLLFLKECIFYLRLDLISLEDLERYIYIHFLSNIFFLEEIRAGYPFNQLFSSKF